MTPYVQFLSEQAVEAHKAHRNEECANLLNLLIGKGYYDAQALYLLGNVLYGLKRYEEARFALTQSIRIDPTSAHALNDLAATLFALRRDAEAMSYIRRALELRPDLPEAEETDSIALLRLGRFRDGWRKYEARYRTQLSDTYRRDFPQPQWHGEPLAGRTILLHAEQGFGDSIQFIRYAPMVAARGGRVVVETQRGLGALFRSMASISEVVERGDPLPHFDVHCPMLSVPLAFDTDLDSIPANVPYLKVPKELVYDWHTRLGPKRRMRIGVAWSGNPKHPDDARRTIPLAKFARLLQPHPGREFHVLQDSIRDSDLSALAELPHIFDHSRTLRDFNDTAALITLMDVVVTVDTALGHVAGALGWPVWLLLAFIPDWRWMLGRDDSPWYPTAWLFRQPRRDDWDSVLEEVARQLDDMLS